MGEATVEVPLRVYARKAKTILAVYHRIRDHYYAALSLSAPSPSSIRWEPHIIIDRTGALSEEGAIVASGPVVLLKYTNREAIIETVREYGLKGSIHLPPWGIPAILLVEARSPSRDEQSILSLVGGRRVWNVAKKLSQMVRVIEVD